ncbi:MAG: endonuclease III [Deltaproteobacteria bacterium]|nr:endonuclease III [Deltaproteobacteria bacterium]
MLNINSNIKKILKILKELYPVVGTALYHKNSFQLLIATILSARCTDKQVNKVVKKLFQTFPAPKDFAEADLKSIEKLIYSTGYYKAKANNIQKCSEMLLKKYNGDIPNSLERLIELPGVGRKTANVVLGSAFGIPGMVVDTHVLRISARLGFIEKTQDATKAEFALMKVVPKKDWNDFSLRLIFFGRQICIARKPLCDKCPLYRLCTEHKNSSG